MDTNRLCYLDLETGDTNTVIDMDTTPTPRHSMGIVMILLLISVVFLQGCASYPQTPQKPLSLSQEIKRDQHALYLKARTERNWERSKQRWLYN